jgi:hypothetical protein
VNGWPPRPRGDSWISGLKLMQDFKVGHGQVRKIR